MAEEKREIELVPGRNGGRIAKPWDGEAARNAARRRWDRAEVQARKAMAETVAAYSSDVADLAKSLSLNAPRVQLMAWAAIVGKQAELAYASDARGSTTAARFVGEASGMLRAGRDASFVTPSTPAPADAAQMARIVAFFAAACEADPALAARLDALVAEREGRR